MSSTAGAICSHAGEKSRGNRMFSNSMLHLLTGTESTGMGFGRFHAWRGGPEPATRSFQLSYLLLAIARTAMASTNEAEPSSNSKAIGLAVLGNSLRDSAGAAGGVIAWAGAAIAS